MGKGTSADGEANIFSKALSNGYTCCTNWTLAQWAKLGFALAIFWGFMVGWMSIHVIVMHDMLPATDSDNINGIIMGDKNTNKFAVDTILLANMWGKDNQNPTDPDFELSPTPWAFDKNWTGACLDMREDDACVKNVRSRENKRANAQDDNWRKQMTYRHVYCKDAPNGVCAPTQQIRIGNQYRLKQLTEGNVVVSCGLNKQAKLFKPTAEGAPYAAEGGELAKQVQTGDAWEQVALVEAEWNTAGVESVHNAFLDDYDLHFYRKAGVNGIADGDVMLRNVEQGRSVLVTDETDVTGPIVVTKENWATKMMKVQFSQGSFLPHIEEYHLKLVAKNATKPDEGRYNVYITCQVELDERIGAGGDASTCIKEFKKKGGKNDKRTSEDEDDVRYCMDHKYRFEGNDDPMFWRVFGINQVQYQYVFDFGQGKSAEAHGDTNGYPFVEAPKICRKKNKDKC